MANAQHLQILQRGRSDWHEWKAQNQGIQPDLRDANLDSVDLSGFDLSGVDFSKANLWVALGFTGIGVGFIGAAVLIIKLPPLSYISLTGGFIFDVTGIMFYVYSRAFRNSDKQSISELKQAKSLFFKLIKKQSFSGLC